MKQLDNTPLNFISNEQDENQLINQVDLRLNENINNIDSTLTGIKNTINKEISNLDLKITKSLHEHKVEVVNNVNNVSSLVNEMQLGINKNLASIHCNIKSMQDGIDNSGIYMELSRYKIEVKEIIDSNFKNFNDQMNQKFIDLSNLIHECSKINIMDCQKDEKKEKDRDLVLDKN